MSNIINKTIFIISLIFIIINPTLGENGRVAISRFDKDLLNYLESPTKENKELLTKKHAPLVTALAQTITNNKQEDPIKLLSKYFAHPQLRKIYEDAINRFDDLSQYEQQLTAIAATVRKETGIQSPPAFSVHISGFKENVIYINNVISLSIDQYLGIDYPGYGGFFRGYQLQQMQPKMVVRDFTKAWIIADLVKAGQEAADLLSKMIEQGKVLYTLTVLLPNCPENDIIGYTDQEYQWAADNSGKIWKSIIKQNQLYSTDLQAISIYFDEQPTKLPSEGAPANMGAWLGFQIVKQYSVNSKLPLSSILKADPRTIFKESKYKP